MNVSRALRCGCVAAFTVGTGLAQAQIQTQARLPETLRRLDAASAKFRSAQAQYIKETYTPPIPDPSRDTGAVYFMHEGTATRMGATVTGQDAQIVSYKEGIVRIYKPGLACFNDYGGGQDQARIESFLTLGFGGSGKSLDQSWNIKDDGEETLQNDGKPFKAEKLELTGKQQSVRNQVKLITIWVDPDRAVSLKQQFDFTSGDRQVAVYSHIDITGKIDTSAFQIPAQSGKIKVGPCK